MDDNLQKSKFLLISLSVWNFQGTTDWIKGSHLCCLSVIKISNVLGILALAELGIGTAIGYSLYEPLAKNNTKKVRSLMQFYKKAYRIIALVVLVLGLILLPVLPYLIKNGDGIENLNIIYIRGHMEKYSSGWRGAPAKGVDRATGARVQIPPSPPEHLDFI